MVTASIRDGAGRRRTRGQPPCVGVQRELRRSVPQLPGYVVDILAGSDALRRVGVTKAVKREVRRELRPLEHALPILRGSASPMRRPVSARSTNSAVRSRPSNLRASGRKTAICSSVIAFTCSLRGPCGRRVGPRAGRCSGDIAVTKLAGLVPQGLLHGHLIPNQKIGTSCSASQGGASRLAVDLHARMAEKHPEWRPGGIC